MDLLRSFLESLTALLPETIRQHGLALVVGVAVLLLLLVILAAAVPRAKYPFRTRPVLSDSEMRLFQVLLRCLPPGTRLLAKVRYADFLEVTLRGKNYMRHFGKISQKHSDFLIIDEETTRPLLCIELDDRSHRYSNRTMESDTFKNEALAAARLPILRLPVKKGYDEGRLRNQLGEMIAQASP